MILLKIRKSIFSKIVLLMILLPTVSGLFILAVTINMHYQHLEDALIKENTLLAEIASQTIKAGYFAHQWPFTTLEQIGKSENILFWWVVKPDGTIYLADKAENWGKKINDSSLGTKKVVVKDTFYPSLKEKIKLIVYPIYIEEKEEFWTLYLGVSLKPLVLGIKKMLKATFVLFSITVIIAIILSIYLTAMITKPIHALHKGTEIIAKGNLDFKVGTKAHDEIGQLSRAFDQMTGELRKSRSKLKQYSKGLEEKVKERTSQLEKAKKQLEEKVVDLQRFSRLAVGRELKMIELKKKIKELEGKIKNKNENNN